jgi:hypothetical protein
MTNNRLDITVSTAWMDVVVVVVVVGGGGREPGWDILE